jgi:hypothetical protein
VELWLQSVALMEERAGKRLQSLIGALFHGRQNASPQWLSTLTGLYKKRCSTTGDLRVLCARFAC